MSTVKVTGKHVTAARGLLGMSQADLAAAANVTDITISNFERGRHYPQAATLDAIREALERRGIEFLNGDAPGVRLHGDKAVIPV